MKQEFDTLKRFFSSASFSVFTYDVSSMLLEDEKVNHVSFFPNKTKSKPLQNITYLIQNIISIAKSDCIIIGGGGLLYDKETQKNMFPIFQWCFRVLVAKLFRVPIIWWSVGINLTQPENLKLLPFLFGGKKTIVTVRDKNSHKLLKNAGITSQILPDAVLGYNPTERQNYTGTKKVGVSFRKGYLQNESTNISQALDLLREHGYEIIFLSQSLHPEDAAANDASFVRSFAKNEELITATLQETLDAYQSLDFVIGMRLHSLILSLVHHIPFIAISYETKTQKLLQDLNYPYYLDTKNFSLESFAQLFDMLEKNAESVKFDLKEKNDTIKQHIESGTQLLIEQIQKII